MDAIQQTIETYVGKDVALKVMSVIDLQLDLSEKVVLFTESEYYVLVIVRWTTKCNVYGCRKLNLKMEADLKTLSCLINQTGVSCYIYQKCCFASIVTVIPVHLRRKMKRITYHINCTLYILLSNFD